MTEMWVALEGVEREILATAVDDSGRLTELMERRAGLVQAICRAIGKGTCGPVDEAAAYDRLLLHFAAGQALGDRLRQERGRVVEAWGESTRERQLLRLLEATRSPGAPHHRRVRAQVEHATKPTRRRAHQ